MIRIAIFADSLPPSTDGVARTYTRFTEYLEQRNYCYTFFSPFKPGKDFIGFGKVNDLPSIPMLFYPHYKIALPAHKFVYDHLKKFAPDIIHVSSPTPVALMALYYARENGIPIVAGYHTDFIAYFKYYGFEAAQNIGWAYLRWFYNKFDKTLVPSQFTGQLLKGKSFKNIDLWTRGIDTNIYMPNHTSVQGNIPQLIFAGRLVKEKDILELIIVCKILDQKKLKYNIVFAGDGILHDSLKKGIAHSRITGFVRQNEIAGLYRESDIFVFPSTTETFGNVVLEALASGLPVVASDGGAAKDLVLHGKTGFIARAHNPEEFAEYTAQLITNEVMRKSFSKEARLFSESFTWDSVHSRLIDIYYELIENKKNTQSILINVPEIKVA